VTVPLPAEGGGSLLAPDDLSRPGPWRRWLPWPVATIALGVPLALLAASSLIRFGLPPGDEYLGIFRYDLLYYCVNARELFENGNGLFYSNPFSASFDGPRVYSHLLLALMGWSWWLSDIPLPVLWQLGQVLFGFAMFVALHRLLACFFEGRELTTAFVVISLGGGGLAVQALSHSLMAETQLSVLDAFRALKSGTRGPAWLPNVFQNALYATEAFYHLLAFATFTAAVRGRRGGALLGVFLTWWAHPFTGLEVGAIVGGWALLEAWIRRDLASFGFAAGVAAISLLFLLYNVVLISLWSIDAADIVSRWRTDITLFHFAEALGMWGLFLAGPLLLLRPRLKLLDLRRSAGDRFVAVWGIVVVVLVLHDRLLPASVPAYQPLHFTRGYLFVPMAILLLRGLWRILPQCSTRGRRVAIAALLPLAFADNALYVLDVATSRKRPVLSKELVDVVDHLAGRERPALVLVDGRVPLLALYLPIATPHRVYLTHFYLTPFHQQKEAAARQAAARESPARGLADLGITFVVGEAGTRGAFASDIAAHRARLAFESGPYHVIEIMLPRRPQPPGPPGPAD
jgi:hypothetical protein